MKAFQTKKYIIHGTSFSEIKKKALFSYSQIKTLTKRRPYIRSAYFKKDKIFLELFWKHLYEKQNFRDKIRRLKYFDCAIELIKHSNIEPISKENPNKSSEIFHRFTGITSQQDIFFVQIKEDKKTNQKWLMSAFPFGKK